MENNTSIFINTVYQYNWKTFIFPLPKFQKSYSKHYWSFLFQGRIFLNLLFSCSQLLDWTLALLEEFVGCFYVCTNSTERSRLFSSEWFSPAPLHCICCLLAVAAAASPSFASDFWSSLNKAGKNINVYSALIFRGRRGGCLFVVCWVFFCLHSFSHCSNWVPCR